MMKRYGQKLFLNTFLLLSISIFSLGLITSSNKSNMTIEKVSIVDVVDKTAAETTEKILKNAKSTPIVEKKEVEQPKQTTKEETKKTTEKKTTTSKSNTKKVIKQETKPKANTEKKVENKTENKSTTVTVRKDKFGKEIGSISISNSNFKKDLVSDDSSFYYLNHTLTGKNDNRGVPFIDYRNNFNGRKTIIYSHSAKDGSAPFNYLQNYNGNKSFYNNHKYITVNYGGKTYTYLIFSAYVSIANDDYDDGLEYYRVMNYTDSAWEKKIQEYKNNSDYDTGVSVSKNDKILILQTCSMDSRYYKKYYRYNQLVMGKLVSVS